MYVFFAIMIFSAVDVTMRKYMFYVLVALRVLLRSGRAWVLAYELYIIAIQYRVEVYANSISLGALTLSGSIPLNFS